MVLRCRIKLGAFQRWYIFHEDDDRLAWSGQRWVHVTADGLPQEHVQACNFAHELDAIEYVRDHPLLSIRSRSLLPRWLHWVATGEVYPEPRHSYMSITVAVAALALLVLLAIWVSR